MLAVTKGLVHRIKSEFDGEELSWLRGVVWNADDLVFDFSATLMKITQNQNQEKERFHDAHTDGRNVIGTSVVVILGDFEGAKVIFPDYDVAFAPQRGDIYLFNATTVKHLVSQVDLGTRCVLIFFTHATTIYPQLNKW